MTRIALVSRSADLSFLQPMLISADPSLDVVVWPDERCFDAEVAVCWNTPLDLYARMPKLRLVHSVAAGVDNVVAGQNLRGLPVCRVVDPLLAAGMLQYVLWGVLYFHRRLDEVLRDQHDRRWSRPHQIPASECRIGVMGLGELGGHVARQLSALGYTVSGWSRTPREITGVTVVSGETDYEAFLAHTDVLVCLLPLTPQTRGILGARTFSALPEGAALIHCGRGEHLVERELIDALGSGRLRGAVVDVFQHEPLDPGHALWTTRGLIVTPHMATMATNKVVVDQIVRNVGLLRQGEALQNQVDVARGY